jgi:two-component system, chemotaxis family, response regulator Rcp1
MATHIPARPVEILLVNNNPVDVRLTTEVLHKNGVNTNLHVTHDRDEAMSFLRQQAPYLEAPRPGLVIMDLNIPRKDGRELLVEVKADPALTGIPVIVLTASQAESEIYAAYDAYASCYIVKPVDPAQFTRVIETIGDFWLSTAQLPGY